VKLLVTYSVKKGPSTVAGNEEGEADLDWDTGVVAVVDWEREAITPVFEYSSPPEHRNPALRVLMKCGSFYQGKFYVVTSTEILVLDTSTWILEKVISLPIFNDLHHVAFIEDTLVVCNTGLDAVAWITPTGEIVRQQVLLGSTVPERFPAGTDFRQVLSTKPHAVHPNYVFRGPQGELFATSFFHKRAVNVANADDYYPIEVGNPHDGFVHMDKVYFTTTNGHVVICDALSRRRITDFNLTSIWGMNEPLGWCRGLCAVEGRLFVSFSRIRATKFREFVSWIKTGLSSPLPSRIVEIDPETGQLIRQVVLPDETSPIFNLLPLHG